MKVFKKICKKTQEQLIPYLVCKLKENGYTNIIQNDGYIYAKGIEPVLLVAHMDTVHKNKCQFINETWIKGSTRLYSQQGIGGDDRCGIYMILEIIKTHKCSVLFCEDEEIGCVGSKKFVKSEFINDLSDLKYLIELDRANSNDAVFYDCNNPEFTEFIISNTGYKEAYGTYTDISYLAPACKVAAVNFSCGYYNAHTLTEYVVWEEMLNTIEVVKKLLEVECDQFEYIESKYYGYGGYGIYGGYNELDEYYGYGAYRNYNNYYSNSFSNEMLLEVEFMDNKTNKIRNVCLTAKNKEEAWYKFFIQNGSVCYDDVIDFNCYKY